MFLSLRHRRAEIFTGLSIAFVLLVSSGHAVSASPGSHAPVTSSNFQPQTGTITVIKRFCEHDNSPNANSNCNGRVEDAEGTIVTFDVRVGADVTAGAVIEQIGVLIAQQGNGSQGSGTGGALPAGSTFTVCEVPVAGYTPVPRPGAQGGQNQTLVPGAPCITVVLVPGNNVLQYNNFVIAVPTATPTDTPEPTATSTSTLEPTATATNTPDPTATGTIGLFGTETVEATATETVDATATETLEPTIADSCNVSVPGKSLAFAAQDVEVGCGSPVVETPVVPEPTIPVTSLPSTGDGNNSSNGPAIFVVFGLTMLAVMMIALAFRRKAA